MEVLQLILSNLPAITAALVAIGAIIKALQYRGALDAVTRGVESTTPRKGIERVTVKIHAALAGVNQVVDASIKRNKKLADKIKSSVSRNLNK